MSVTIVVNPNTLHTFHHEERDTIDCRSSIDDAGYVWMFELSERIPFRLESLFARRSDKAWMKKLDRDELLERAIHPFCKPHRPHASRTDGMCESKRPESATGPIAIKWQIRFPRRAKRSQERIAGIVMVKQSFDLGK